MRLVGPFLAPCSPWRPIFSMLSTSLAIRMRQRSCFHELLFSQRVARSLALFVSQVLNVINANRAITFGEFSVKIADAEQQLAQPSQDPRPERAANLWRPSDSSQHGTSLETL